MSDAKHVPTAEIVDQLDLEQGQLVWLASDITRLAYSSFMNQEKFSADSFIDDFKRRLGADGTLLLPTFSGHFTKGQVYDIRSNHCETGALANRALQRDDFRRTLHPIHSFAVTGKHQLPLCELTNNDSFGPDSPFAYLHDHPAKMIIIDLDYQRSFTFVHYVENQEGVWYRRPHSFTAEYIDEKGNSERRAYSRFSRRPGVFNDVNLIGEILEQRGISIRQVINDVDFLTIDLRKAYDAIRDDIRDNGGRNLYRYAFLDAYPILRKIANRLGLTTKTEKNKLE